jgi:hypothetical protein
VVDNTIDVVIVMVAAIVADDCHVVKGNAASCQLK